MFQSDAKGGQPPSDEKSSILRQRKSSRKDREVSLLKNRGGYYMTGDTNMEASTTAGGYILNLKYQHGELNYCRWVNIKPETPTWRTLLLQVSKY